MPHVLVVVVEKRLEMTMQKIVQLMKCLNSGQAMESCMCVHFDSFDTMLMPLHLCDVLVACEQITRHWAQIEYFPFVRVQEMWE